MSEEKQRREARRWLRQAEDDLEASRVLLAASKYPQASRFFAGVRPRGSPPSAS